MVLDSDVIIIRPNGCPADIAPFTHKKITFCRSALFYLRISKIHLSKRIKFKTIPVEI